MAAEFQLFFSFFDEVVFFGLVYVLVSFDF
jgi:hypothetical protein